MKDKLLHKMTIFFISFLLLIPASVQAIDEEYTVDVHSLKVRSGPGITYSIIGSVKQNEKLKVIGKENDWLQIKYGSNIGWVASWYTSKPAQELTHKQIVAKVNHLNVRTQPSTSSAVIGQLNEGEKFLALRMEGDWVEIDFQNQKGWVNNTYITIIDQSSQENTLPSSKNGNKKFTINVDTLNVRAKADLSSKKLGQVKKGEAFKVLDIDHQWVQIEISGKKGWVYSFYGTIANEVPTTSDKKEAITVLYNGTNIRSSNSTTSNVVYRAAAGEMFTVQEKINDWYKIELADQTSAYVASWVVSSSSNSVPATTSEKQQTTESRKKGSLKGVSIVIDAGHGGNDRGTTGALGTDEKDITLKTAEILASKLQAAGATVIMTRESDEYVDLRKRVSIGHQADADAFISLHYDAIENSSVRGFTTYYMHGYQKDLAKFVHEGLGNMISLRNRGVQPGNYLVLRENKQKAILIELGYLSNPTEEQHVTTHAFREQASHGIYNGIINYFDSLLK